MSEMEEPHTDLDSLDCIFYMPEDMYDADLRFHHMYEVIKTRLQREAVGLPLGTIQELLLERIASMYVTVKYREATDGFKHASEQRELNSYLMSLFQEWNKVLRSAELEERQVMTKALLTVLVGSLKGLDIPNSYKTKMVDKLGTDLEKAGWVTQ
jgi:hypothetical protein